MYNLINMSYCCEIAKRYAKKKQVGRPLCFACQMYMELKRLP